MLKSVYRNWLFATAGVGICLAAAYAGKALIAIPFILAVNHLAAAFN